MKRHLALTSTQQYMIGLGVLALLSMACAVPPSHAIDPWRPAQLGGGSPLATPELLPTETATTETFAVPVQIATIVPVATMTQSALDSVLATATPSETLAIRETMPISESEWVTLTVNGFLSATQQFTGSKLVVTGMNNDPDSLVMRFTTVRFDSAAPPTDTERMIVDVVGTALYRTLSGTLDTPLYISTTITGTQFCQESIGLTMMGMFPIATAPVAFVFDEPMTFTAQLIDRDDLVGRPTNHYRLAPISYTAVVVNDFVNLGMARAMARPITVSSPSGEVWVSDSGDLVRIVLTDAWTTENSDLGKFKLKWPTLAAGFNDNGVAQVQLPEICKDPVKDTAIFAL